MANMSKYYGFFTDNDRFGAVWEDDKNKDIIQCIIQPFYLNCFSWNYNEELKEHTDKYISSRHESLSDLPFIVKIAIFKLSYNCISVKENSICSMNMEPGKYFPRIWRGRYSKILMQNYSPFDPRRIYGSTYIQSIVASCSLFEQLHPLFRYIEPDTKNLDIFGHRIRELLILTCTEIEASWRGILKANNTHTDLAKRYSTNDYVMLKEPLRLNEWCVCLQDYPNMTIFNPFNKWDSSSPTTSLEWYDAYNKVKHDRENRFSDANLNNLLNSMAALHILQCVQWGPDIFELFLGGNRKSPFIIETTPKFKVSDFYIPKKTNDGVLSSKWTPIYCKF